MSTQSSPSPRQAASPDIDEANLPKGQCRFILVIPEIKGHRCACVGFSLNKGVPGAMCDCGHLACYHVKTVEPTTDKHELDKLKLRVQELEELLDRERPGGMLRRLSQVEEHVDKAKEEFTSEIKETYRKISRVWQSVEQTEKRLAAVDQRLEAQASDLRRLDNLTLELREAGEIIEEKMDELKNDPNRSLSRGRRRNKSTSRTRRSGGSRQVLPIHAQAPFTPQEAEQPAELDLGASPTTPGLASSRVLEPVVRNGRPPQVASSMPSSPSSQSWTVHVSLLPSASSAMPYERNTNAYNRCLSRGLHRTVAVTGRDSESFVRAVSQAFEPLLQGRPWMPLQAKLCNAQELRGLPMLRPLDASLASGPFDAAFLRDHCAVLDARGEIDSLYIALTHDTLSWSFLRNAPVFMEGLESSWLYDSRLDGPGELQQQQQPQQHHHHHHHPHHHPYQQYGSQQALVFEDDMTASQLHQNLHQQHRMDEDSNPGGGADVNQAYPLKRTASEISRASSFGSGSMSVDGSEGGSRPKVPRRGNMPTMVEVPHLLETTSLRG